MQEEYNLCVDCSSYLCAIPKLTSGGVVTVKYTPLLTTPPTITTTLPEVAPLGTGTAIEVSLQLVVVALVPLNATMLETTVGPKLVPVIVTEAPHAPEVGDKLVMLGGGRTAKLTPLLATPLTVTTTLPVLAPVGTCATIDVRSSLSMSLPSR